MIVVSPSWHIIEGFQYSEVVHPTILFIVEWHNWSSEIYNFDIIWLVNNLTYRTLLWLGWFYQEWILDVCTPINNTTNLWSGSLIGIFRFFYTMFPIKVIQRPVWKSPAKIISLFQQIICFHKSGQHLIVSYAKIKNKFKKTITN